MSRGRAGRFFSSLLVGLRLRAGSKGEGAGGGGCKAGDHDTPTSFYY